MEIFPIPNDEDYCVKFIIDYFREERSEELKLYPEDNKTVVISIKRKFITAAEFGASSPFIIALDSENKKEYTVSFAVNAFGVIDKYTSILLYSFVERDLTEGTE